MAVPKSIHKLNCKITPDINDWTPPERSLQNFHFSMLDTSTASFEKEVWLIRSKNNFYTHFFYRY